MKARIKETGEVLIVEETTDSHVFLKMPCSQGTSIGLKKDLVDLLQDDEPTIDWEQRRYELAKEAMGAFIASPSYQFFVNNNYYEASVTPSECVAKDAVDYADVLISELRKSEQKDEFSSIVEQAPNLHKALEEIANLLAPEPMTWKAFSDRVRGIALSAIEKCK